VLEAQNFSDLTHRQSLGWHGAPRCCSGERAVSWRLPVVCPATLSAWPPSSESVAQLASESVAGMDRNHWPLCLGIRTPNSP
jgi:hypothetical protein